MPGTYPPPPPTFSGDLFQINRFLAEPARIAKRLQQLEDIRFVADLILPQRFRSSGGAVAYDVSEPLFNDRDPRSVSAGAEYPRDTPSTGAPALASVSKWGQAVRLTDERMKRTLPIGGAVDWALRKVSNTVIRKVDRLAISAVASAITQVQPAIGDWADNGGNNILRDIEIAGAVIDDLEMGYQIDTILMSTNKYALLMSDDKIANLRRRETTDNPVYGGEMESFAGLKIARTSVGNLPGGSDDVWLIDSKNLGGMADETEVDPGYATAQNGLQVQTLRKPEVDAWDVWARRITVPVIQEPGAGIRITNS